VRAVIVHQHGASIPAAQAGATSAYDLHWQALAKKWNCVLLGPSYRVLNDAIDLTPGGAELWFDPRQGSDRAFLRALDEFATKSGHVEIATVPWCLWGHSGGGIWANVMSILHPDRVLAAFLRSGTAAMFRPRHEFIQPEVPPAVYEIPTMVNFGIGERGNLPWDGSIATFQEYRTQGAPIGFAPDPRTGHFCGDSRYLAIPFFDACLQMRLTEWNKILRPADLSCAWLATPFGDTAMPAAEFKGNPIKAAWLPNEAIAKIWMEYVRTGTVTDAGAPPAPFNVRANADANHGNEITWEAEADIVSGLGGFIVLRDGRGIAKLPTQPPEAVYGRPLFQGLSYHDTPFAPLPQMRHVDISAQFGAKHVYTVIALSSAGVPSMSSLPAAVG
jgi:pimeloyl-ACP methyl ester carboxylesterase